MRDEHEFAPNSMTDCQLAWFRKGMIRVRERQRQRVQEGRCGLFKRNPVLNDIPPGLATVPLENHELLTILRRVLGKESSNRISEGKDDSDG